MSTVVAGGGGVVVDEVAVEVEVEVGVGGGVAAAAIIPGGHGQVHVVPAGAVDGAHPLRSRTTTGWAGAGAPFGRPCPGTQLSWTEEMAAAEVHATVSCVGVRAQGPLCPAGLHGDAAAANAGVSAGAAVALSAPATGPPTTSSPPVTSKAHDRRRQSIR
ncbi:MAG: hypothetical protein M3Y36_10675 [Actinomycetota bacterium]|nr:hypothetical protein [Actinomycetota bacterium]